MKLVPAVPALFLLVSTAAATDLAAYQVRGSSMTPATQPGETAVLDAKAYIDCDPERGDIVGIRFSTLNTPIIKRVVAVPGDTLRLTRAGMLLNGRPIEEPYLQQPRPWPVQRYLTLIKQLVRAGGAVPEGHLVVLGDNPAGRLDSGRFGLVDRHFVIGRLVAVKDAHGQVVSRPGLPDPAVELPRLERGLRCAPPAEAAGAR